VEGAVGFAGAEAVATNSDADVHRDMTFAPKFSSFPNNSQ
jgi:hypothetical protein